MLASSCHDATSRRELATNDGTSAIAWQPFTDAVFTTAKREKKLVLLDVGTGWCHWCHVMDETTYQDPKVVALVGTKFVAARADADERLDLANRYEAYGWPATIVFDANGTELVKMRGFMEPQQLTSLLQACVDDPTPGPSARRDPAATKIDYATSATLDAGLRAALANQHLDSYDDEHGGFGGVLKFLPEWSVEYDLELARRGVADRPSGDAAATKHAQTTLDANLALIDPAWGGVYQYSHGGDWSHPHFEKIMSFQSLDLRLYAQASELFGERHDDAAHARYVRAAQAIHSYLAHFLRSPNGAFYTSQDADLVDGEHGGEYFALDDAHRRALGLPRIDRNVYARENGWAIEALAFLYEATGDESALAEAEAAARTMLATRRVDGGGFRHGDRDAAATYLGDTLAMGVALYELHLATGERAWLGSAIECADFVEKNFRSSSDGAGYTTALARPDASGALPKAQRDENATIARFANRLFRETGDAHFQTMVDRALRLLVTPEIARQNPAATTLLVVDETSHESIHVTIVGSRDDANAKTLFTRALRIPTRNKLVQWFDPKFDPPLPDGATYPDSDRAAAYFCANGGCSPPVYDVAALERSIAKSITR